MSHYDFDNAPTTEYFPAAAAHSSLQEHWDALHHNERADARFSPELQDAVPALHCGGCDTTWSTGIFDFSLGDWCVWCGWPLVFPEESSDYWREAREEWAQRDNAATQAATPRALQETP